MPLINTFPPIVVPPQGRLTPTSGTPVIYADVTAGTIVYFTPDGGGRHVPIWNGSYFAMTDIGGELSNDLTQSSTGKAGPAAVGASKINSFFIWKDAGTIRLTRSPDWTSDLVVGSGAGTAETELVNGFNVNKYDITNGPLSRGGIYVGCMRSNASSQLDYKFGSNAAGGGPAWIGLWNYFNRLPVRIRVTDNTAQWTYVSATTRSVNASDSFRVSFVSGSLLDAFEARYIVQFKTAGATNALAYIGLALDANNAMDQRVRGVSTGVNITQVAGHVAIAYMPRLGFHYIQATEASDGTYTATYNDIGNSVLSAMIWA